MRFIPRQLLIHSAEVYNILSENCLGEKILSEKTVLKYIRIDAAEKITYGEKDGFNLTGSGSATLIYDCRSSLPKNFEFSAGQKIVYNGMDLTVNSVSKLYEKKRLHHIEVGLIM